MKVTLPWTTRLLIFMQATCSPTGGGCSSRWWSAAMVGFFRWKAKPDGPAGVGPLGCSEAPVVRQLVRMLAIARFSRTLATLLQRRAAAHRDGHHQES